MRCELGDICVIVANCPAEGALCLITRRSTFIERIFQRHPDWECELMQGASLFTQAGFLNRREAGRSFLANDTDLRPLRDGPGADETLTWTRKPAETPAEIIRELAPTVQREHAR